MLDIVVTANGKIVTLVQNKTGEYEIVIYSDGEGSTRLLETKASGFAKSYKYDNDVCYIFEGSEPESYNEVVWF